jgi:hypothetical protein
LHPPLSGATSASGERRTNNSCNDGELASQHRKNVTAGALPRAAGFQAGRPPVIAQLNARWERRRSSPFDREDAIGFISSVGQLCVAENSAAETKLS